MAEHGLAYRLPQGAGPRLILSPQSLTHMGQHRQMSATRREAGGQLFARFIDGTIHVVTATGPRRGDRRGRLFFHADQRADQREINAFFKAGLHYVGDWHTHPEDHPTPSSTDVTAMKERFLRSRHQLRGVMMVIVGRADPPRGLYVGQHDGQTLREMVLEETG